MAKRFRTPPGWPAAPEDWTPPPGWEPDPSWPSAPAGWEFWEETEPRAGAGPSATEPRAAPNGSSSGTSAGMYDYAASPGLEPRGPAPYPEAETAGQAPDGDASSSTPAPAPAPKRTGLLVAAVVAALVLAGVAWGVVKLLAPVEQDPGTATAPGGAASSTPDPASNPDPTQPSASPDPADPSSTAANPDQGDEVVDLAAGEPALTYRLGVEPLAEFRLLSVQQNWEPETWRGTCIPAEEGQYILVEFEVTTLPALADRDSGRYRLQEADFGVEIDGAEASVDLFGSALCKLSVDDALRRAMEPDRTYTGVILMNVPSGEVTAIRFDEITAPHVTTVYRWVLADQ